MPPGKTKARKDAPRRTSNPRTVPMDLLFEPWELVNWSAINDDVAAGKPVHIQSAGSRDDKHWVGCALRELGRQNVHVAFCHSRLDSALSYGLWVIPRTMLSDVLLEEYERVYD